MVGELGTSGSSGELDTSGSSGELDTSGSSGELDTSGSSGELDTSGSSGGQVGEQTEKVKSKKGKPSTNVPSGGQVDDQTEKEKSKKANSQERTKEKKQKKRKNSDDDGTEEHKKKKTKSGKIKEAKPLPRGSSDGTAEIDGKIRKKCKGEYRVPVHCLVAPPEELLLREVDEDFVKTIVAGYNPKLGFATAVFPVQVVGKLSKSNPQTCQYQTLGGNHLRSACYQLEKKKMLQEEHKMVNIKVYRKLTTLEALRVASQHNYVQHNNRQETFREKVLLARRLLRETFDLEEEQDIPQGNSRDGRKMAWREKFGLAMYEKDASKEKLNKYTTIFNTAALDNECWEVAEEIMEEEQKVGAGVFKCLHGLERSDMLALLTMRSNGELKNGVEMRAESQRMKKMTSLRRLLTRILEQPSWQDCTEKYPVLTEDSLHSYLSLDWDKEIPRQIKSLCASLISRDGTAMRMFSFRDADLKVSPLEDVNEPVVVVTEIYEKKDNYNNGQQIIVTNFDIVSDIIADLDSYSVHCIGLEENERVIPVVITPESSAKKIINCQSVENGVMELVKTMITDDMKIFCTSKDYVLAALRQQINVIADDESGTVRDHVVAFLQNMSNEEEPAED